MKDLINKIEKKEAIVGIIGLGYVGLPLLIRFAEEGFRVIGFDIDEKKVKKLNKKVSYIHHISSRLLEKIGDKFIATTDFRRLNEPDCILICVPTPLTEKKEPDLRYIERTVELIKQRLRKGQLIILESTTYPGTTEELILGKLSQTGLKVGKDFFLAFSPEREDPGNKKFSTKSIPKIVGGVTSNCTKVSSLLYSKIIDKVIEVSSPKVAELTKLLENIYRSVNIALVNELTILCERMGINVWEVIEAAKTKPYGFMPFYPGPGLGGHCIPVDPFYLAWKAKEDAFNTRFIELAGEINDMMPYYVVERTARILNQQKKCLNGAAILILGVAYKKDVGDLRESPALKIIALLEKEGAIINYNDPYVPLFKLNGKEYRSVELNNSEIGKNDLILITTDHTVYDYQKIVNKAKLVFDTRNATKSVKVGREKIHLL